jgi:hypothetical protein
MACHDERVAAVVAGAGEHEDRTPTIGDQCSRQLGRRETGTLHQRRLCPLAGERLDAADLSGEVNGKRYVRSGGHARGHESRQV